MGLTKKDSKKIMIVDDEPDIRQMLTILLQNERYETEVADRGSVFLDKVDVFQPDLTILDVMMPGLKTEEILTQMKNKKCKPKIILLTVVRLTKERLDKLKKMNNIVGYIKKPYDLEEFLNSLKHIL